MSGLTFLHRKNQHRHIQDTVLDGEMVRCHLHLFAQQPYFYPLKVIDTVNGEKFPRFLIYDIIRYEGNEVKHFSHIRQPVYCQRKDIKSLSVNAPPTEEKGTTFGNLKLGINGNLPMPSGMRKVVSQIRKRWPRRFILLSAGGLFVISVK